MSNNLLSNGNFQRYCIFPTFAVFYSVLMKPRCQSFELEITVAFNFPVSECSRATSTLTFTQHPQATGSSGFARLKGFFWIAIGFHRRCTSQWQSRELCTRHNHCRSCSCLRLSNLQASSFSFAQWRSPRKSRFQILRRNSRMRTRELFMTMNKSDLFKLRRLGWISICTRNLRPHRSNYRKLRASSRL